MARRILPVVLTVPLGGPLYTFAALAQCTDCDGDGYEWPTDCDNAAVLTNPLAAEVCDGFDNDCNALIDDTLECDRVCDYPGVLGGITVIDKPNLYFDWVTSSWNGINHVAIFAVRGPQDGMFTASLDLNGVVQNSPVRISDVYPEDRPAITWTGEEHGAVWPEGSRSEVYFVRLDIQGNPTSAKILVADGALADRYGEWPHVPCLTRPVQNSAV